MLWKLQSQALERQLGISGSSFGFDATKGQRALLNPVETVKAGEVSFCCKRRYRKSN